MAATVGVALVGTASLALAQLGHHDGLASVAIATVVGLGLLALARREGLRPVAGIPELVLVGLIALASLFMSLPGFPYAYADKDPGIYVVHALAIAREGDAVLDDPVLAADLPGAQSAPGARLPGVWTEGDAHSTSQFFHFFSSLTATAVDLTDERGRLPPERAPRRAVRRRADARGAPRLRAADRGHRGRAPRHLAPAGVADEVPDH